MRKKSTMKIARGRLEEDRRKSEDTIAYQRVMLFMLPIIMVSILVIGVYFGYLSYKDDYIDKQQNEGREVATEPKFTQDDTEYLLTVVSSANTVDADFVPQLKEVSGVQVCDLMADDLEKLLLDAKNAGLDLKVDSGYISFEEQKEKYNNAVAAHKKKHKSTTVRAEAAVKKTIPNAGECEQQTGLIVKFSDPSSNNFKNTDSFDWLMKNCVDYGFVLRYPDKENTGGLSYSPQLFRYVGVENAFSMRAYNMNLDEYVQYLRAQ